MLFLRLYQGRKLGSWIYVLRRCNTEELLKSGIYYAAIGEYIRSATKLEILTFPSQYIY